MNESYEMIKTYDELLRISGTDFSDRSDIDNHLAKIIDVQLRASDLYITNQYMLAEANNQILSTIFTVFQYPLLYYLDSNEIIYFVMQNTINKKNNYMAGLLETIDLYRNKASNLDSELDKINLLFFLISFGFTFFMIIIILIIYMKIRKSKLYVMSFFIHIPTKSLEEILQNCDEFISGLTMTDARIGEVDDEEREIIHHSHEEETGSSISLSQQQYFKKYKKHSARHNRTLSDDCNIIFWTILKFLSQFVLVAAYFVAYFLVAITFHKSLSEAGTLSEKNGQVELDSINMLVLMKESINADTEQSSLSSMYLQLNNVVTNTISLMKGLENVFFLYSKILSQRYINIKQ